MSVLRIPPRLSLLTALAIILGALSVFAVEAPLCRDPKTMGSRQPSSESSKPSHIKVIQLDHNLPLEELKLEGYDVVPLDEFLESDPWGTPDPVLRNRIFYQSGVSSHVRGWNQLKRDMLFLRAQEQSLGALKGKYPEIPEKTLAKLMKIIAEEKKAGGAK